MPGVFRRPPRLPGPRQSPTLNVLTIPTPAVLAGSAAIVFGQSGALQAGATLAGSSAVTFGQSGALKAGASLAGATAIVFGQTGNLAAGAKFLNAGEPIVFGATGTFVAGTVGAANFAGTIAIVFGATATFSAGGGADQPQPPRGAWISDERVEHARDRRFREQREEARRLRRQIEEEINPPTILPPAIVPAPAIAILPVYPDLDLLRAQLAELQQLAILTPEMILAEQQAALDEEAGIVALLLAA